MNRSSSSSAPLFTAASRLYATMSQPIRSACLRLVKHGAPKDVLQLQHDQIDARSIKPDQLLLDILAAPINPSDVNMVEGKYPVTPSLPSVAGFEGVACVRAAGTAVQSCAPGDWVIPTAPAQGTWRQCGIFPAANWHKIAIDIPVDAAATLFVKCAVRLPAPYRIAPPSQPTQCAAHVGRLC